MRNNPLVWLIARKIWDDCPIWRDPCEWDYDFRKDELYDLAKELMYMVLYTPIQKEEK